MSSPVGLDWVRLDINYVSLAYETLRRSYAEASYTLRPESESFLVGGTLMSAYDVILDTVSWKAYSGVGPYPQDVAAGTNPLAGGFIDRSEELLRSARVPIDPRMPPYNYRPTDSISARTASLQAAFEAANTTKLGILINDTYYVSSILLENHTDYHIFGGGAIIGASTGSYVLGIKNCTGLTSSGRTFVTGPDVGYTCGAKVWASGESSPGVLKTCSLHHLDFKITNVTPAWIFGEDESPDNLLSEIVVEGGYTYNVSEVARIIGSQAVIEFRGYQSIVARAAGVPVPFTVKGGVLHINGGELQMPGFTNGYTVLLLPLNSPGFDNKFGSCFINGTAVESASLWMLAYNPANVPNIVAGSGKFVMDNCSGFTNFSGDNIQADSSFTGSVVITDTCEFHRTSAKPAATFVSGIQAGKAKIADNAFDANFNKGLQFYRRTEQLPLYGHRSIFTASNLSGQSFPQSTSTVMKFSSIDTTGQNGFYSPDYSVSTGIFTVPAGGLKSVKVLFEFNAMSARPNSEVTLLIDSAIVGGICGVANKYVSQMFDVGDLAAGQTLQFRFTNLDTGFSVGTSNSDRFVISARTE
jgi:hypothetical protein